jgi:hypothetical protein
MTVVGTRFGSVKAFHAVGADWSIRTVTVRTRWGSVRTLGVVAD